jgi:ABC transporter DrrB family efflux protein
VDRLVAEKYLPLGVGAAYSGQSYQERASAGGGGLVFGLGIVIVFLVLAAQYESWSLPLAVILVVPMCLLSALAGVNLAGMDMNIFTQIGFVVLVGLASKNAILIVEFARHQRLDAGLSRRDATLAACKLRLRPIVMTSLAFILGVLPLIVAHGAGAEMRRTLGTAVFSGMLGVTLFGIVLTPVFFSSIDWLGESHLFASSRLRVASAMLLDLLSLRIVRRPAAAGIARLAQAVRTANKTNHNAQPGAPPPSRPADETKSEIQNPKSEISARRSAVPPTAGSLWGLTAMLVKEFSHIRREPATIFFMLVVPVLQTVIFGYAIETEIDNIPTVVHDLDGRKSARELIDAFRNTRTFAIIEHVHDDESFRRAISSGRARVGVRIPPDYTERLMRGQQVQVQVLIDGSDSQVATTALQAANLLGSTRSIQLARSLAESAPRVPARDPVGKAALPIEMRPRLLFNPALESSHFFVPGLVGIIMQLVTIFLTSFAIVRERELGTLEQLFVTPVGRMGLLLGKLTPYACIGFVEMLIVLTVMVYAFGVPIHGNLWLLLALSTLFLVCALGLGLLVSTVARTQLQAMQFAFLLMLPSVLLSGFMFPRGEMPPAIYLLSFGIPVTYFLEILRGIVLRDADFIDLVPQVIGLAACCLVILVLSVTRFRKQLA